ncbi:MAG: hypothetical protein IJI24_08690 [Lachnospiraceae bacterium]|nr:hypothetical protein [Lachnospiraceae bacterium]
MIVLLCRLYAPGRRYLPKSFLCYYLFFLITLTFLYDLLMLYDNEIHAVRGYGFDYLLTDFDQDSMEVLSQRADVEDLYGARLIGSSLFAGHADTMEKTAPFNLADTSAKQPSEDFQVYLVDSWDDAGLSFLSTKHRITGSRHALGEESMVLDVLSARTLGASLGDRIYVAIGDEWRAFRLDMILEPEYVLNTGIAICLYTRDLRAQWLDHFSQEPSYSVLFLKGKGPALETWLYEDYAGPMSAGLNEAERRQINRACIIKKEWILDDIRRNFLFTPPAVFAICLSAFVLAVFFVRREGMARLREEEEHLLVLRHLGLEQKIARKTYLYLTGLCMSLGCVMAAVTVKKGIYDRFMQTHYLSWRVVWMVSAMLCLLCFVILAGVGERFFHRIENAVSCRIKAKEGGPALHDTRRKTHG